MRSRLALAAVSFLGSVSAVALVACSAPTVTDLGSVHEEDGIAQLDYDAQALSTFVLPEGVGEARFDLRALEARNGFDTVGVRWDAITEGGMSAVQVRPEGTTEWKTVIVDSQELLDDGRTIYAGHITVPRGAKLETRFHLIRKPGNLSPRLTAIIVEAFGGAQVAESGELLSGDGADGLTAEGSGEPIPPPQPEVPGVFLAPLPTIVGRETWGARPPRCSGAAHNPSRMTFHETVTPNGERGASARARMRQMQSYHQDSRGWCDIGYHFVIDADGVIYRGRVTSARAASHVSGENIGNIGVALMGTFNSLNPSSGQVNGLMDTFAFLADEWGISVTSSTVRGHTEWSGANTECPGDHVLDRKSYILSGVLSRLSGTQSTPAPTPQPTAPPVSTGEVIVDNASGGFTSSQSWFVSTAMPTPFGADYQARPTESLADAASWAASLDTRDYEVYVRYTAGSNRATSAPFFVLHRYGDALVYVDQTKTGSQWVSLGTYSFGAGYEDRVLLSCWTVTGDFVIADAVRLVPR